MELKAAKIQKELNNSTLLWGIWMQWLEKITDNKTICSGFVS
jgi:hypothetical protein